MDTQYGKPNPSGGLPVQIYDLSGVGTAYAEAAANIGWDATDLVWRKILVDTLGQIIISNPGSGGGGGGIIQVGGNNGSATNVGYAGTQLAIPVDVVAGGAGGGVAQLQVWGTGTAGTWTNVGYGTTTGTANLNVPVQIQAGTAAVTQVTSPWVVTGTVTDIQSTSPWVVGGTVTNVPSGTQTVAQSGSPWGVSGTITAVESGTWSVTVSGTATTAPTGTQTVAGTVTITPSGTQTITGNVVASGTVAVSTVSGTSTVQPLQNVNTVATGSITASGSSVQISCAGLGNVISTSSGVWSGTLAYQVSVDGVNWAAVNVYPQVPITGPAITTSTSNTSISFPVSGFNLFRITASAWTSGTATITINGDQASYGIYDLNLATGSATVTTVPSGTQSVAQTGSPWGVSGTVAVSTLSGTSAVSGTVTITPSGTQTVTTAGTNTVAGTVTITPSGTQTVQPLREIDFTTVSTISAAAGTQTYTFQDCQTLWLGFGGTQTFTGTLQAIGLINGTGSATLNIFTGPSLTGPAVTIPTSGTITNQSYFVPVSGFSNVLLIPTTWTSGTATIAVEASQNAYGLYALNTTTVAGTVTAIESGTWQVGIVATTSNTIPSTYMNIAISTTGTNIKASAAALYGYYIANLGSAMSFVKLYNTNTAPTTTNVPIVTIGIPSSGAANLTFPYGLPFSVGLGIYCSGSATSTDSTAPSGSVVANIFYA